MSRQHIIPVSLRVPHSRAMYATSKDISTPYPWIPPNRLEPLQEQGSTHGYPTGNTRLIQAAVMVGPVLRELEVLEVHERRLVRGGVVAEVHVHAVVVEPVVRHPVVVPQPEGGPALEPAPEGADAGVDARVVELGLEGPAVHVAVGDALLCGGGACGELAGGKRREGEGLAGFFEGHGRRPVGVVDAGEEAVGQVRQVVVLGGIGDRGGYALGGKGEVQKSREVHYGGCWLP